MSWKQPWRYPVAITAFRLISDLMIRAGGEVHFFLLFLLIGEIGETRIFLKEYLCSEIRSVHCRESDRRGSGEGFRNGSDPRNPETTYDGASQAFLSKSRLKSSGAYIFPFRSGGAFRNN